MMLASRTPALQRVAGLLATSALMFTACSSASTTATSAPETPAPSTPAPTTSEDPGSGPPRLEAVWDGFDSPVAVVTSPEDPRVFVVQKTGAVLVSRDGEARPDAWLDLGGDLSDGTEQGLLGMALHPDFGANGRLFLDYTDREGDTHVVEVVVDPSAPGPAVVKARRDLLHIDQPYPNHNGGNLAFGPDGRLWIGTGDGGGANDPEDHAQDEASLLGKMLRLDVDSSAPPQVWAKGLRNPWRYSFDTATGDLWIGDVGQAKTEEIDVVRDAASAEAVLNFGWPTREGDGPNPARPAPPPPGAVEPVLTYPTRVGGTCAVTGGVVYRGPVATEYAGKYFFGDACSGQVWSTDAADPATATDVTAALQVPAGTEVSSFGQDSAGRLYIVDLRGSVLRLTGGHT